VVAGCVRVRCMCGCGGAELSSQIGISCGWLLALLDEAESFFISHIRQARDRACGSCCSYLEISTDDMPGRSIAIPLAGAGVSYIVQLYHG
jgi:hypothetical protein